jgi:tRNA dimethylallyltransferase
MNQTHAQGIADCWFLTGPTAGGKSTVALLLAERIDAEIISMDSMAIYRGMDIGTAKPSAEEQRRVPHHLIDCFEPDQECSLAQYVEAAHRAADQIKQRGREVLFVGGTPLYLKALLRGIFEGPTADWELRGRLHREAQRDGPEVLHHRLAEIDPPSAQRLHPNDQRRIIRAIEVFEKTGQRMSHWQQQFDQPARKDPPRVFVLDWPREELYKRIELRVVQMFDTGLVGEVQELQTRFETLSRTAAQALGYREVIEHLAGVRPLAETVELVQTRTRQFARRQLTWFRSLSECHGIEVSLPFSPAEAVERIVALAQSADSDG